MTLPKGVTVKGPKSDTSLVKADVTASNAVIHVFDPVMMPLIQPSVSNGEDIFFDYFFDLP